MLACGVLADTGGRDYVPSIYSGGVLIVPIGAESVRFPTCHSKATPPPKKNRPKGTAAITGQLILYIGMSPFR